LCISGLQRRSGCWEAVEAIARFPGSVAPEGRSPVTAVVFRTMLPAGCTQDSPKRAGLRGAPHVAAQHTGQLSDLFVHLLLF